MIQEKEISQNIVAGEGEVIIHIKDLYKRFGEQSCPQRFQP